MYPPWSSDAKRDQMKVRKMRLKGTKLNSIEFESIVRWRLVDLHAAHARKMPLRMEERGAFSNSFNGGLKWSCRFRRNER